MNKNNISPESPKRPEDLELNPFIHFANHKPKRAIIIRWVTFSVVLTILTVLVANKVPVNFDQLNAAAGEENLLPDINKMIEENPSAKNFLIVVQGITAFFSPIVFILITTVALKILTSIIKPIFKEKVSMEKLFLTSTIAYTAYFISSVLRLVFSLMKGEFIYYSLGSLPYYTSDISNKGIFTSILNTFDVFSILFCVLIAFGLFSYSKAKFTHTFALILGLYLLFIVGQAIFFPVV